MSPANSKRPPKYFVDRSLGRYEVPAALRRAEIDLVTMAEQKLPDEEWLADVRREHWVVLTKDTNLTRSQANGNPSRELAALMASEALVFCLMTAKLSGAEQAQIFLNNWRKVDSVATSRNGPLVYGLYSRQPMRQVWPLDRG